MVPDGIEHIERPSTMLYSPRIPNPYNDQIKVGDSDNSARIKVYYATSPTSYKDIYEFIFACRVSKLADNYFYVGPMPTSVAELKTNALLLGFPDLSRSESSVRGGKNVSQPGIYNLVSGDKLVFPLEGGDVNRDLVHRYMMMGLHYFQMYNRAGLGNTRLIQEQSQSRIVSAGEHLFKETQGWLLNVSNIFIGMLIDYYRIESSIVGMNAQLSFAKEPEFRYFVYKYLKAVFVAFVKHNEAIESENLGLQRMTFHATHRSREEVNEQTNDNEIISRAAKILNTLV